MPHADADHQHLPAAPHIHANNRRERRRVEFLDLLGDLLDGVIADLLSRHPPVRFNTEQHLPAAVVEHGAQRAHGLAALVGRALKLECLGFARTRPNHDLFQ